MSDFKSKLPDFKELSSMTSKLFKGIKSSVEEIIHDYKEKRAEAEANEKAAEEVKNTETTVESVVVKTKSTAAPPVTPVKEEPTIVTEEKTETVEKKTEGK